MWRGFPLEVLLWYRSPRVLSSRSLPSNHQAGYQITPESIGRQQVHRSWTESHCSDEQGSGCSLTVGLNRRSHNLPVPIIQGVHNPGKTLSHPEASQYIPPERTKGTGWVSYIMGHRCNTGIKTWSRGSYYPLSNALNCFSGLTEAS